MSSSASRSLSAAHGSIRPYFGRSDGGAARNRFSATLRPITSVIVWYAMPSPSSIAALADAVVSCSPAISTTPSSGTTVPLAMPSNVDLPEPFSPSTAWISPARTSSDTSSLACTGPYRLETPRSDRTVGAPSLAPIDDTVGLHVLVRVFTVALQAHQRQVRSFPLVHAGAFGPVTTGPKAPTTAFDCRLACYSGNILDCSSGGTRLDGAPSGGMSVRQDSSLTSLSCDTEDDLRRHVVAGDLHHRRRHAGPTLEQEAHVGERVHDAAGVLPGAQERVVVGLVHRGEPVHRQVGCLVGPHRADERIAVRSDPAVDVVVLGEDARRRLEVRLATPRAAGLGHQFDVVVHRLERALLLHRVDRVAGCAEEHRDLAAVGQQLVELLAPGVAEGAEVAAAVGQVVDAGLADLAGRPRHDLGAFLGRRPVGGDQRLARVGEAEDHVVALGGEARTSEIAFCVSRLASV